jgi:hypothetical protein
MGVFRCFADPESGTSPVQRHLPEESWVRVACWQATPRGRSGTIAGPRAPDILCLSDDNVLARTATDLSCVP